MKATNIILWVIWAFLFLAWSSDMLVALMGEPGEATEPDKAFVSVLGFVGLISLCLTFVFKWFLFRFLINPKRVGITSPWAIVIFIIGSLIIWGMAKSVETYGLLIFFRSRSLMHYLAFWIPSLLVMLIHMPFLLDPRRAATNAGQCAADQPASAGESE